MPVQESYDVTSAERGVTRTPAKACICSESRLLRLITFFVLSGLVVAPCHGLSILWTKQDGSDVDNFNKSSGPGADVNKVAYTVYPGSEGINVVSNQSDTNRVTIDTPKEILPKKNPQDKVNQDASSTSKPRKIRSAETAGESGDALEDGRNTPQETSGITTESPEIPLESSTNQTGQERKEKNGCVSGRTADVKLNCEVSESKSEIEIERVLRADAHSASPERRTDVWTYGRTYIRTYIRTYGNSTKFVRNPGSVAEEVLTSKNTETEFSSFTNNSSNNPPESYAERTGVEQPNTVTGSSRFTNNGSTNTPGSPAENTGQEQPSTVGESSSSTNKGFTNTPGSPAENTGLEQSSTEGGFSSSTNHDSIYTLGSSKVNSLLNDNFQNDIHLLGDKNLPGRRRVSGMLSHMNHMADPCEDLYEYACGEFESNPLILQKDLFQEGIERIFAQAKKTENSSVSAEFLSFYNSCVNYEKNMNQSEKMKLAIEAVDEVGTFTYPYDASSITDLLSKLFLRNSIPLFDITPDVVAHSEAGCGELSKDVKFTLKIGPPILDRTYYSSERERDCYEELNSKRLAENVDLNGLYTDYLKCKRNPKSLLESVQKVLQEFPRAKSNEFHIRVDIDVLIMDYFSEIYPAEDAIREAYLTKNYTEWTLEQLQAKTDPGIFDWKKLVERISNSELRSDQLFQVYFANEILQGLEAVSRGLSMAVYNPFVGLYAHTVYDKLVAPKHDVENHCKSVTVDLMKEHASSLYMLSFSSEELEKMNEMVMEMFKDLKDTLKSSVKKAPELQNSDDALIIRKIDDLSIVLPNISYYQNGGKLDPENIENKVNLTGNYFHDVMTLESHNRKSMYGLLKESPSGDEYIWKYFAQSYQNSSSAIYALNKIILPYGIADWATLLNDQNINSKHLALATLGTRIAKEIAHHFGPTGIKYFGNKRSNGTSAIFCNDANATQMYSDHIGTYLPINESLLLPSTQQTVSYKISDSHLNERFADKTGLQLAYDTMLRLPNNSKIILPWLNDDKTNEKKQFSLAYAQMYCTKVPVTSSYKSFYEGEHLPSRLLISVASSSNQFWGDTWECPKGSKMRPENISSAFPNMGI